MAFQNIGGRMFNIPSPAPAPKTTYVAPPASRTVLAPSTPPPGVTPSTSTQGTMQATYSAGSSTPSSFSSNVQSGYINPVTGRLQATSTAPSSSSGASFQSVATPSASTVATPTSSYSRNSMGTSGVSASPSVATVGYKKDKDEEARKAAAIVGKKNTSTDVYTNWKKANPTGTYQQWLALKNKTTAAPPATVAPPVTPEAPGAPEAKEPGSNLADVLDSMYSDPGASTGTGTGGDSNVSAIQQAIINALRESPEEKGLEDELNLHKGALTQGLVNIEDQPIAMPFITGQQAALQRHGNANIENLVNQLATIQSRRQSALQAGQTQLGFEESAQNRTYQQEQDKYNRQFQQQQYAGQQKQQGFENQLAMATKGLKYDPATGQFSKDPNYQGGDPVETVKLEQGLRKEYTDSAKTFEIVRDNFSKIQASANDDTGSGDLALLFSYMKILDPTSVVRESEFDNASQAMGYLQKTLNIPQQLISGTRLTQEGRQTFVNSANNLFQTAVSQHDQRINEFTKIAQSAGVNPQNVVINLGAAGGSATGGAGGSGGTVDQSDIDFWNNL